MEFIQQALPVGAVLALLAGCLWFLKRKGLVSLRGVPGLPRKTRRLEVIERLQLTPQHALCLVRMNQRTILVATAPAGCHLLDKEEELSC